MRYRITITRANLAADSFHIDAVTDRTFDSSSDEAATAALARALERSHVPARVCDAIAQAMVDDAYSDGMALELFDDTVVSVERVQAGAGDDIGTESGDVWSGARMPAPTICSCTPTATCSRCELQAIAYREELRTFWRNLHALQLAGIPFPFPTIEAPQTRLHGTTRASFNRTGNSDGQWLPGARLAARRKAANTVRAMRFEAMT